MNTEPFVLGNCAKGATTLGHAACSGWQRRFSDRPEHDTILICSCPCGHEPAKNLASKGVQLPPPGWDVKQFVKALASKPERRDVDG